MKIDQIIIKEPTDYCCSETGERIYIGDSIQWYTPHGTLKEEIVRWGEDGTLLPLDLPAYPSRMTEFGGMEYVDTDDIMMKIADIPFVKVT